MSNGEFSILRVVAILGSLFVLGVAAFFVIKKYPNITVNPNAPRLVASAKIYPGILIFGNSPEYTEVSLYEFTASEQGGGQEACLPGVESGDDKKFPICGKPGEKIIVLEGSVDNTIDNPFRLRDETVAMTLDIPNNGLYFQDDKGNVIPPRPPFQEDFIILDEGARGIFRLPFQGLPDSQFSILVSSQNGTGYVNQIRVDLGKSLASYVDEPLTGITNISGQEIIFKRRAGRVAIYHALTRDETEANLLPEDASSSIISLLQQRLGTVTVYPSDSEDKEDVYLVEYTPPWGMGGERSRSVYRYSIQPNILTPIYKYSDSGGNSHEAITPEPLTVVSFVEGKKSDAVFGCRTTIKATELAYEGRDCTLTRVSSYVTKTALAGSEYDRTYSLEKGYRYYDWNGNEIKPEVSKINSIKIAFSLQGYTLDQ